MIKFIATFFLSVLSLCAVAQSHQIARIGLIKSGDSYSLSYPTSTIAVELLVEEEVVTPGIYARYAQKYLSYRAPLVATTAYKIIDASISLVDGTQEAKSLVAAPSEVKYSELPIDQYSSTVLSAEESARDAASAIFTIRRQRKEIINGEAGEGYFGAGLKEAMDRLDAMEQKYLELFMGKYTVKQVVKHYVFNPQEGATRHVAFRFDPKMGVLPESDLTGIPIYLQFTPQAIPDTSSYAVKPKSKVSAPVWFRIAAPTQCVLYSDSEAIATAVLPLYELGKSVEIETIDL
ncbi:MAG: DUF4831 family protein [Rikenellaceae bacterium]